MHSQDEEEVKSNSHTEGKPLIKSNKPTKAASLELTGFPEYGKVHAHRRAWQIFENDNNLDQTSPDMPDNMQDYIPGFL